MQVDGEEIRRDPQAGHAGADRLQRQLDAVADQLGTLQTVLAPKFFGIVDADHEHGAGRVLGVSGGAFDAVQKLADAMARRNGSARCGAVRVRVAAR